MVAFLDRALTPGLLALWVVVTGCAPNAPPASTGTEPEAAMLRVVSYNIRHGRGMDGRVDLERTAAVLRRLDADIVALQEVDERVDRSGGVDQAARLGELLGMRHAFGSFFDYQGGRYGLAIQAREVARLIERRTGPVVILGDFNARPGSRTLALFDARALSATKPAEARFTFPADAPDREIDHIFVMPAADWSVDSVAVVAESTASDHRPVLAVLAYRPSVRAPSFRRCAEASAR